MKLTHRLVIVCALLLVFSAQAISAQWDKKVYTEWSEKEAQKILDNSPWGQTQTVSNTSRMFNTGPGRGVQGGPPEEGSADHINFRIRFLSAKPIRQAFSRLIGIKQKDNMHDQLAAQLKAFAGGEFPDYIVVSVNVDSREQRGQLQKAMGLLQSRTTAELKNNTYLAATSNDRVFLDEFQAPKGDGLGAKFIFKRLIDGKPFVDEQTGDIKFYAELSKDFILTARFKVKEMMFDGKLEY